MWNYSRMDDFDIKYEQTIAVSGGFDPLHVGHVRMINHAAVYGNVIVVLNSDNWLKRKKGYIFMPYYERQEIIWSLQNVSVVCDVDDSDDSICLALEKLRPNFFGNGGDRALENIPEKKICEKLGIKMIWNLGGEKMQSSSDLVHQSVNFLQYNKG